jgi:hypothetical protein
MLHTGKRGRTTVWIVKEKNGLLAELGFWFADGCVKRRSTSIWANEKNETKKAQAQKFVYIEVKSVHVSIYRQIMA